MSFWKKLFGNRPQPVAGQDQLVQEMTDSPESWAQRLMEKKDYRALAAVNNSEDYSEGFQKWEKRDIANRILMKAGAEAVDAIMEELATDGVGSIDLAGLLVDIGDPKAVPLLKRKLDRGDFSAHGSQHRIREFVTRHPELHGTVETVECALCGKRRLVTAMHGAGDTYFCVDTCWKKRGRVLHHGTGTDCPFYSEGMCTAGDGDLLCSLQSGSYESSCHVYAIHTGTLGL